MIQLIHSLVKCDLSHGCSLFIWISSRNFSRGGSFAMQIFIVMLIFLLFFDQILGGNC